MAGLLTQHALCALNVFISSADLAEAERALNSYWYILADSLSEESV